MPQSNTPDAETYGGINDNDYLYPSIAPTAPNTYTTTPPGAPMNHAALPPVQPSNFLDFITAGQPNETFHNLPAQFFDAFQVKKRKIIVPRPIYVPAGGNGLIIQGQVDVFGYAVFSNNSNYANYFRDGIDMSGQPVMPIATYAQVSFGLPGVRFYNGVYADFSNMTEIDSAAIFILQDEPGA